MTSSSLFQPFHVHGLTLPNRIVMAPMTREASPDGVPGDDVAEYYGRRAAGGAGLIITEATDIDHPASWGGRRGVPRFFGDDALAGWRAVVDRVHAAGGAIMPQLWHIGAELAVAGTLPPDGLMSPSGLSTTGRPVGTPMTTLDIDDVVESFARAASHAKEIGFDGIEIGAHHGFLIDQFLWAETNRRTDSYGGSIANRSRFGAEIVAAARAATGPDFPIVLRTSQWKVVDYAAKLGRDPQELEAVLAPFVDAGVDVFDCSTRRFWIPEFEDSELTYAGWVKKLTGRPTIAVGSVGLSGSDFMEFYVERKNADIADLRQLETMIGNGDFDLAAVGRALIADPGWPRKIASGEHGELVPFEAVMADSLL